MHSFIIPCHSLVSCLNGIFFLPAFPEQLGKILLFKKVLLYQQRIKLGSPLLPNLPNSWRTSSSDLSKFLLFHRLQIWDLQLTLSVFGWKVAHLAWSHASVLSGHRDAGGWTEASLGRLCLNPSFREFHVLNDGQRHNYNLVSCRRLPTELYKVSGIKDLSFSCCFSGIRWWKLVR